MASMRVRPAEIFKTKLANYNSRRPIAFFCMEYLLGRPGEKHIPLIYSGGLGVLAGDWLKSAADRNDPLVGVGLLYRDGYFNQVIVDGKQLDPAPIQEWSPKKTPNLYDLQDGVTVNISGRQVAFRLWGYDLQGHGGGSVPLILLDSRGLPNPDGFINITKQLYLADPRQRLYQDMALGIGGMRALSHLGLEPAYYHLNEGHAAFATIEFLRSMGKAYGDINEDDMEQTRQRFSFTTHTPVPAGFDRFDNNLVRDALSGDPFLLDAALNLGRDPANTDFVHMALLAFRSCGFSNGVSQLHGRVSEAMFPEFVPIIGITNGIHHLTWISGPVAGLLDRYADGWKEDPAKLAGLSGLSADDTFRDDLWQTHRSAKKDLLNSIDSLTGKKLDADVFTIGFGRRFATYKRADLLFYDEEELQRLAREKGSIQLVFAGKAHPNDTLGRALISEVIKRGEEIEKNSGGRISFVFLQNYGIDVSSKMVAGVDIWLNNPERPKEASGTSGMKAAANAVPHLSTEDGWWEERRGGGWTINEGQRLEPSDDDPHVYRRDAQSLYSVLGGILDSYYHRDSDPTFVNKMIEAIAGNGSYFNTHRMQQEYMDKAWSPLRVRSAVRRSLVTSSVPPHKKLLNLGAIGSRLARSKTRNEIENLVAGSALENLPGCNRVNRYSFHAGAVKLVRRWRGSGGVNIFEEQRNDLYSKFKDWTDICEFEHEVMGDLIRTGETQVVNDPKSDPRCHRNGTAVSESPFILIPEVINGRTVGAYKFDFQDGIKLGAGFEDEFLEEVVIRSMEAKNEAIRMECEADLSSFKTRKELVNWVLTLFTAGGFLDMPRYSHETNRAAFFANTPDGLAAELAVGDTNHGDHSRALSQLEKDVFQNKVEAFFRNFDQSGSALNRAIAGKNIGKNEVTGPILYDNGFPLYDRADFGNGFEGKNLADMNEEIKILMQFDGKPADRYLLLPVYSENRSKLLGLLYLDNAVTRSGLDASRYQMLVSAFGKILGRLQG